MILNITVLLKKGMGKFKKPIKNIDDLVNNSETIIEEFEEKKSINIKKSYNNVEEKRTKVNITELLREKMIKNN